MQILISFVFAYGGHRGRLSTIIENSLVVNSTFNHLMPRRIFFSVDSKNSLLLMTSKCRVDADAACLHIYCFCSLPCLKATYDGVFCLFQLDNVEIRNKKGSLHFIRFPTAEMNSFLQLARHKGSKRTTPRHFYGNLFKFISFQMFPLLFSGEASDDRVCHRWWSLQVRRRIP